jgi:hypothetical protein
MSKVSIHIPPGLGGGQWRERRANQPDKNLHDSLIVWIRSAASKRAISCVPRAPFCPGEAPSASGFPEHVAGSRQPIGSSILSIIKNCGFQRVEGFNCFRVHAVTVCQSVRRRSVLGDARPRGCGQFLLCGGVGIRVDSCRGTVFVCSPSEFAPSERVEDFLKELSESGRNFSPTGRSSLVSSALYTTPIPSPTLSRMR